jgi:hypothetical protein
MARPADGPRASGRGGIVRRRATHGRDRAANRAGADSARGPRKAVVGRLARRSPMPAGPLAQRNRRPDARLAGRSPLLKSWPSRSTCRRRAPSRPSRNRGRSGSAGVASAADRPARRAARRPEVTRRPPRAPRPARAMQPRAARPTHRRPARPMAMQRQTRRLHRPVSRPGHAAPRGRQKAVRRPIVPPLVARRTAARRAAKARKAPMPARAARKSDVGAGVGEAAAVVAGHVRRRRPRAAPRMREASLLALRLRLRPVRRAKAPPGPDRPVSGVPNPVKAPLVTGARPPIRRRSDRWRSPAHM